MTLKRFINILILLLLPLFGTAQEKSYADAFAKAYRCCPSVPRGLLEAVSYTNTRINHLTDADYHHNDSTSMPRAYGLMGLVKDGKNYFRENLHTVSALSRLGEDDILNNPEKNILAYAKAYDSLLKTDTKQMFLNIVEQLSELPADRAVENFATQSFLYSVCSFLNDTLVAANYGFEPYQLDLEAVFGENLPLHQAKNLTFTSEADYPNAIWNPAPECNYGTRTEPVSGVVIHYTEGSYAGCISWFKNCDAGVSAHYVIRSSDGQVTQMVREADKAWHARSANAYTVGIEHEAYGDIASFFTEAMYESSAMLVRNICQRNGIDPHHTFYRDTLDNGIRLNQGLHSLGDATSCTQIRGHQHYPDQTHTDPGPYWQWNHYYKLINSDDETVSLFGTSGTLNHENYQDDERMMWVVEGPPNTVINLRFESFELEKDYDFLWIYDGDNEFARKIGRWNTRNPQTVTSTGNTMCIEFRSDCATTAAGWKATWQAKSKLIPVQHAEKGIAYPNPVENTLTIDLSDEEETPTVHHAVIYNLDGQPVSQEVTFIRKTQIDLRHLSKGVYILRYGASGVMDREVKIVKM